jgi:hypothetical protein
MYGLTCTGPGGSTDCVPATVSNSCGSNPAVGISARPDRIVPGGSTTISWSASGVYTPSCTIWGPGLNVSAPANACAIPNGSQSVTITRQSTYTITCGTASKSVTVNVLPKFQEF